MAVDRYSIVEARNDADFLHSSLQYDALGTEHCDENYLQTDNAPRRARGKSQRMPVRPAPVPP